MPRSRARRGSGSSARCMTSGPAPRSMRRSRWAFGTCAAAVCGCGALTELFMAAFCVADQAVVRHRLPRGGVRNELADARANARVAVERPHAYRDRIGMTWIATEERRSALAAEPLLATVLRLPHAQLVFAGDDAERTRRRQ